MKRLFQSETGPATRPSYNTAAWLIVSGLGGAVAALVVVGIAAGRLGLPIRGGLLLGAAVLGALPQLGRLVRGRWQAQLPVLAAMLLSMVAVGGFGLGLAWPALLPIGMSVDAIHHTQMIDWIAAHAALPPVNGDTHGLLGEMNVYPVGLGLVALAASLASGRLPVEVLYPTTALLGALSAGLVVLLASAGGEWNAGSLGSQNSVARSALQARRAIAHFLVLLIAPLLLLVHRTYFLDAYTDHSYYTMVLGVLLLLLAAAWLIVPARPQWSQFGLVMAALAGTYPLWVPLPAAFAALAIFSPSSGGPAGFAGPARPRARLWVALASGLFAFGPALALALLDVAPRLAGGQAVLAHEGVVAMPTAERLAPILLALPGALLLLQCRSGRRLARLAGLTLAQLLALAVAARLGLVASYHSYKTLFLLLPLAAAIVGAALGHVAQARRPAQLVAAALALLALAISGSFQLAPTQRVQALDQDMVAAASWLRAAHPREAERAIAVGVPAGPTAYWLQVGLLGQRRDRAEGAMRAFASPPPTIESWLIDSQLPPVAIAPSPAQVLPGMRVVASFGTISVIRRAGPIDAVALNPLTIRYQTYWEDQRLKTAIEIQHPLPGALPLLEVALYHDGALVNSFPLQPAADRARPQYLGVDLLPDSLGGEGYINVSSYPQFAPPAVAPAGALTLKLRLSIAGNSLDERELATMRRTDDGRFEQVGTGGGELVYLRHGGSVPNMRATALDFEDAVRLTGWRVPKQIAAHEPIAVDLRWQALQPLERSLFPELQLVNAAGQTVAGSLAAPQNGFYPTWRWRPGESVIEQRSIQLPPGLDPGVYRLVVQIHDFGARRVLGANQAGDHTAEIGQIVVGPAPLAQSH